MLSVVDFVLMKRRTLGTVVEEMRDILSDDVTA